jgi:hypothetical protein
MPSIATRLLLFLSSYFPLALIFFVLFIGSHRDAAIATLSLGVIGLFGMYLYLRMASRLAPIQVKVVALQRLDAEAMSYIVTYVIPFVAIPFGAWQQGVALVIFFVVLGILYVNSNMIHINPMLNLAGYHLFEVSLDDGSTRALITRRRRINRDAVLAVVKLGDDILLDK